MEDYIVHYSKGKLFGVIVLWMLLLVIGFWIVLSGFSMQPGDTTIILGRHVGKLGTIIIGILYTLACLWGTVHYLKFLLFSKPLLVANKDGLSGTTAGFVAWEDIDSIELVKYRRHQYVTINVHDLSKVKEEAPLYRRYYLGYKLSLGYPVVTVEAKMANVKYEEVLLKLQEYIKYQKTLSYGVAQAIEVSDEAKVPCEKFAWDFLRLIL